MKYIHCQCQFQTQNTLQLPPTYLNSLHTILTQNIFLEFQSKLPITMFKLLYLNQTQSVLQYVNKSFCVIFLLCDNLSGIHENCQFAVVTNSLQPDIFVLDSKHVLLTNISDAILNCPDYQKRNVTCVGFCKVSIPCRCLLTSANFYLPARIEDCHKDQTTVTVLHTLNLAFFKHFF